MKTLRRITTIFVIVLMLVSLLAGCQETPTTTTTAATATSGQTTASQTDGTTTTMATTETTKAELKDLKIKVYTAGSLDLKRQPVENVLVDIWREKTKVTPEFETVGTDMTQDQYVLMQIAAGTLPAVIHSWDLMRSAVALEALNKADMLYKWDADMIKTYMPGLVESMAVFNATAEKLLTPNVWEDGVNYYLPKFIPSNTEAYNDTKFAQASPRFMESYFIYLRDDILKMIYPDVLSEKELLDLYIAKKGNLTVEELFGDIPIKNKDDMIDYLRKVKDLNMKVGEKPVYGAQLLSSTNLSSALWSASTLWFGVWQGGYSYKGEQWTDLYSDPSFKEYMRWFNDLYNEKLIDPEAFIQTGDQMTAKINNGEYAVVNFMVSPGMGAARQLSIDQGRGYDYRMLPGFLVPQVTETQDLRYLPTSLYTSEGVFVTKTVKEEDLPQVLGWLDWNMSLEAEDLRSWGTNEFYTGDGENRRFKPEYADVEKQKLDGTENIEGKDATYYGLNMSDLSNIEVALFGCPSYYDTPKNVYPKKEITEATPVQLDTYIYFKVGGYYPSNAKYYFQNGWTYSDVIGEDYKKSWDIFFADNNWSLAAQAVVAKKENFDAKWQEYVDVAYTPDFVRLRAETVEKYKKLYNEKIKPDIEAVYGAID